MRVLMAIQSLTMGGAEKFFLNLAQTLSEKHEVHCYIPGLRCSHPGMAARLGQLTVHEIAWFTPLAYRVFYKATLMIQKRRPLFDPELRVHKRRLRALHKRHCFDVVNAQLMPAARQVCSAFETVKLPIVKSDHGDTQHFEPRSDAIVMRRLDALVCPAEANARRAASYPLNSNCQVLTIPYGYRSSGTKGVLPAFEGVTFGMVARGVKDKGWQECIAAARLVKASLTQNMRLVLVGDGPEIKRLRVECNESWILFAGEQSEPETWVRGFDVALLPSCLPEESLPNSIIEYLSCGRPVIATSIGGIPEMVMESGILVPLASDGRADVTALAAAMVQMADAGRRAHSEGAAVIEAQRYSMQVCAERYEALFASLIHG
jgi:L-malate glycosyltransferase